MKSRAGLFLLAIVLAAAVIFAVIPLLHRPSDPSTLRLSFDVNQIEKIQIGKGGPADDPAAHLLVTLVKAKRTGEQDWKIPDLSNASVDHEKVNHLLKQIRYAKGRLVTKNRLAYSEFGLSHQDTFRVSLFNGKWKPILILLIGSKTDLGLSFIRRGGSKAIYQVEGDLLSSIGIADKTRRPSADYWLAKAE